MRCTVCYGVKAVTSLRCLEKGLLSRWTAGTRHDDPTAGSSRAGRPKGGDMRRSLITIGLAIGLLAGTTNAASATTPAKLPVLYNLGGAPYAAWNLQQIRPGIFYIFADGSAALVGAKGTPKDKPIHWKSWTQGSASAQGYFTWRDSAAPGPYNFSAATITLWDVKTRASVRFYDKMTIDFTKCRCNSHVVLQYRTIGSGKYIAGGWDVVSGRFPGGVSPAQHGAAHTTSVVGAGASAVHRVPAAPELVFKNGRYRVIWGVRPAGRFTIYSGPGVYLLGTHWTSWTATAARATGQLWGVDAKRVYLGAASIVLSAPKSHDGRLYYSALHIIGGKGVAPYWRWYWSGPQIGWSPAG
jgi:hypothetical protein